MASLHEQEALRLRVLLLVILAALVLLTAWIWRIQVVKQVEYRSSETQQSIRRVRRPAPRGRIYDRHGVLLAGNRPRYSIAVYAEELRQPGRISNTVNRIEHVLDDLSATLKVDRNISREDILVHIQRRRPLPLLAWTDLDEGAIARWAESGISSRGVDLYVDPVRVYPRSPMAGHLIGYVGRRDWSGKPSSESYHYYLPDMEGRAGVERTLNERLSGKAGGRLLRVDASGFKHDEQVEVNPVPGRDVVLSIDARIQSVLENALIGERGACVVMDPGNGDILGMASAPPFDASILSDQKRYAEALKDPARPMWNRAIAGTYPPGSTFKPVVSVTSLINNRATAATVFDCPGYYEVGDVRFHCWRETGHGPLDMRRAIEQSCNAYYCELGVLCGYERIYHVAEALGFGHKTGIDLVGEKAGLLPDGEWKRRVHGDSWRIGDTCNASIGQGALLVTPLQMAVFTSALANGGRVLRPRLVADPQHPEGEVLNRMRWERSTFEVVRAGMIDVVHADSGTGRMARLDRYLVAGKTGSAEYGPRSARKKYAWMIAFAPAESPRYAVVIVIEDALSGGRTAAPRVKKILEMAFEIEEGMAVGFHAQEDPDAAS